MNCCVSPFAMVAVPGVTARETRAAGLTVMDELAEMPDCVAVTLVLPAESAVTTPVIATAAIPVFADDHATEVVMACDVPSVYVPVAVNCCDCPFAMEIALGTTAILTRAGGPTVRLAAPENVWLVAETIVVPAASPVASPAAVMVATVGLAADQRTREVKSSVVPSENRPVAVNCCVVPLAIEGPAGLTVTPTKCASGGVPPPVPPQPARNTGNRARNRKILPRVTLWLRAVAAMAGYLPMPYDK